jgi:hypothetical protein
LDTKKWHAWKHKFRTFLIIIYESNPWRKFKDFLTMESPELQPDAVIYKSPCPPIMGRTAGGTKGKGKQGEWQFACYIDNEKREKAPKFVIRRKQGLVPST